jgi:hypothetical protein
MHEEPEAKPYKADGRKLLLDVLKLTGSSGSDSSILQRHIPTWT